MTRFQGEDELTETIGGMNTWKRILENWLRPGLLTTALIPIIGAYYAGPLYRDDHPRMIRWLEIASRNLGQLQGMITWLNNIWKIKPQIQEITRLKKEIERRMDIVEQQNDIIKRLHQEFDNLISQQDQQKPLLEKWHTIRQRIQGSTGSSTGSTNQNNISMTGSEMIDTLSKLSQQLKQIREIYLEDIKNE